MGMLKPVGFSGKGKAICVPAAVATLTTMIFTWLRYGKPDVSMTFNATLAGLVGITAGCDAVNPIGAAIIGICCGFGRTGLLPCIQRLLYASRQDRLR